MGARVEAFHGTPLQLAGAGYLAETFVRTSLTARYAAPFGLTRCGAGLRPRPYARYRLLPPAICLLWARVATRARRQIH